MSELAQHIHRIPVIHDGISYLSFVGVAVGFLIGFVLVLRKNPISHTPQLLGAFFLITSWVSLDLFLCYTGWMKYFLWANDGVEFLTYLIGPSLYLVVYHLLRERTFSVKKHLIHFIWPAFYLLYSAFYLLQPLSVKYNSYIVAYRPDLPSLQLPELPFSPDPLSIKAFTKVGMLLSLCVYIFLSVRLLIQTKLWGQMGKGQGKHFLAGMGIILLFVSLWVVFFAFASSETDYGHFYISLFSTTVNVGMCVYLIRETQLFERTWIADKYETSGLHTQKKSTEWDRVKQYIKEQAYYLQEDASLSDLAQKLSLPATYLSQVINAEGKTRFQDLINAFRIEEATNRLGKEAYAHLSIEGIGKSVGFRSKSAFYRAFKKHHACTPLQYIDQRSSKS